MTIALNNQQMSMARRILAANAYDGTGSIVSAFRQSTNYKHDFNKDFGYPETSELTFEYFYEMWKRNGFARGIVEKTRNKTWQTNPKLSLTNDVSEPTPYERRVYKHFDKIRLWQALSEADMRSLVGKYAGVIFQLGDGRKYDQPVRRVPGGIEGIVSIIPCWEKQLEPSEWDRDPMSPNYGKPSMFRFNESAVDSETGKVRSFTVHPDRCMIWSADGTTWGDSKLEPCYNALLDVEKIRGAGGEGYWKNSKAQPVLQASPEVDFAQLATMLGVDTVDEIPDALDTVITRWVKGFDQSLMLQGMEAKTIGIDIQEPKSFFDICMQEIAASWPMPQKILVGMQTGERASTEDAREWAQINMSRRENLVVPNIMEFVRRLVSWGCLIDRDWKLDWDDLTAPTLDEKLAIGERMARINGLVSPIGSVAFDNNDIRELAGYPALDTPITVPDKEPAEPESVEEPEEDEGDAPAEPEEQ